jgi:transcription elongation factor GreA
LTGFVGLRSFERSREEVVAEKVHMTRRGYEGLQERLRLLKVDERRKIVREIQVARELGDLSENAEYHAAKERQGHLEARIREIEDKLARAEVIDTSGQATDRVRFGATVVLEDSASGEEVSYMIVGEDEADVSQGRISIHSPVARALIGKEVDDEVIVRVPSGTKEYEIHEIRYE